MSSKAINIPLAKIATKVMTGIPIRECDLGDVDILSHENPIPSGNGRKQNKTPLVAVKEAVFPFIKFPGVDIILSPEMKSTGEVMGLDTDFGRAFAKAQIAVNSQLPLSGTVFVSVNDKDKIQIISSIKKLSQSRF